MRPALQRPAPPLRAALRPLAARVRLPFAVPQAVIAARRGAVVALLPSRSVAATGVSVLRVASVRCLRGCRPPALPSSRFARGGAGRRRGCPVLLCPRRAGGRGRRARALSERASAGPGGGAPAVPSVPGRVGRRREAARGSRPCACGGRPGPGLQPRRRPCRPVRLRGAPSRLPRP